MSNSPYPSPSDADLLPVPSQRTAWIADNWAPIIGSAAFAHIGHYRYLTRYRKPSPNARFWALASGGWMVAYLSVITGIAVAQAKVNHYRDPDNRHLYSH